MPLTRSRITRQFVPVLVKTKIEGRYYNPSADTVQMAFINPPDLASPPTMADAHPATWERDGRNYVALCLVGPGGTIALGPGVYGIWIHIGDNPEDIWEMVDTLTIE